MSPTASLLSANARWAEGTDPALFERCAKGQSPKVLWIGCSDSRIPESVVTGASPGDIFVHRNIANQFHHHDDSALSVLAFAVDVVGVEHVVVAGHTQCGGALACLQAVQSTPTPSPATDTPLGRWLAPLTKLVTTLDLASTHAASHLDTVVEENVKLQVKNVCESDVIKASWAAYTAAVDSESNVSKKQVWVHGWVYDVASGRIKDLGISRGPSS
ncbi:hypothetical protein SCLCIDRAFT_124566 [Scleroderma citrinum Foug A]|uniref:Carbonic anhydrase n=1 Tax=Scleroderma citrinum Foug A TaxID=1036808 RepID=A0A0C3DWL1_9AGAM|nr:hypothetical protein SCLCIDRAFT_124566 [Scleroderma citrinum Foug A]